jgi:integration host factor subunit beta
MTKSKLINLLASRFSQLVYKDAELSVKTILDAMGETLSKGKRIEIRGFGSFSLNYRPPRLGRNPKTGSKVEVPEKYVPHFKAYLLTGVCFFFDLSINSYTINQL